LILEKNTVENSTATVERIVNHIVNKKGSDIVVLDLRRLAAVADYFVIATGNTNTHVQAIADEVRDKLRKEHHAHPWHVEGESSQRWILLDYVDVVVHVFDRKTREFYDLEGLYLDAGIRRLENED
jgi:ribosome-associated protein